MKTLILKLTTLSLAGTLSLTTLGMQEVKMQHAAQQAALNEDAEMPQAPDASGKEAKAETEQSSIVTVPVPEKFGGIPFNLDFENDECGISLESFGKLAQAQAEHFVKPYKENYLLAHVVTRDDIGREHTGPNNCWDAHSFLETTFGGEKWGGTQWFNNDTENAKNLKNIEGNPLLDPHNKPIKRVEYYLYNTEKRTLIFLCDHHSLFARDKDQWIIRFCANQNINITLKINSLLTRGLTLFNGGDVVEKDYQQASIIFRRILAVATKNELLGAINTHIIYLFLHHMYLKGGHGLIKNYDAAIHYLKIIVQTSLVPHHRREARTMIEEVQKIQSDEQRSADTASTKRSTYENRDAESGEPSAKKPRHEEQSAGKKS